jgi:hypothetical protein
MSQRSGDDPSSDHHAPRVRVRGRAHLEIAPGKALSSLLHRALSPIRARISRRSAVRSTSGIMARLGRRFIVAVVAFRRHGGRIVRNPFDTEPTGDGVMSGVIVRLPSGSPTPI